VDEGAVSQSSIGEWAVSVAGAALECRGWAGGGRNMSEYQPGAEEKRQAEEGSHGMVLPSPGCP